MPAIARRFRVAAIAGLTAGAAQRKNPGEDHPDTLECMNTLADLLRADQRLAEVEAIAVELNERARRTFPPNDPALGNISPTTGASSRPLSAGPKPKPHSSMGIAYCSPPGARTTR